MKLACGLSCSRFDFYPGDIFRLVKPDLCQQIQVVIINYRVVIAVFVKIGPCLFYCEVIFSQSSLNNFKSLKSTLLLKSRSAGRSLPLVRQ
jgi:hypothetical protein